jgi:hypothetical protein
MLAGFTAGHQHAVLASGFNMYSCGAAYLAQPESIGQLSNSSRFETNSIICMCSATTQAYADACLILARVLLLLLLLVAVAICSACVRAARGCTTT